MAAWPYEPSTPRVRRRRAPIRVTIGGLMLAYLAAVLGLFALIVYDLTR